MFSVVPNCQFGHFHHSQAKGQCLDTTAHTKTESNESRGNDTDIQDCALGETPDAVARSEAVKRFISQRDIPFAHKYIGA